MDTNSSWNGTPATKKSQTSLDPKILDRIAWARHDGGRGKGPPRVGSALADDGEEPGYGRRAALRQWLLAALDGDEDALHLLLMLSGDVSYRELAAAIPTKNAGTLWRWVQQLKTEIRWARVAEVALTCLVEEDGFTIDVLTAEAIYPETGCIVSMRAAKARFRNPTLEGTKAYLRTHARKLLSRKPPQLYFGGWEDPAMSDFEYDLSVWLADRDSALAFAIAQGQRSIWDCRERRAIDVADQDGRQAA